jgi:hypothetical protein
MAYDAAMQGVILFGGRGNGLYADNDTWEFQNGTWKNITPAVSPPAREDMCMVWDATGQFILLFGGDANSGPVNDTWEFAHGRWTPMHPHSAPPAVTGPSCASDPNRAGVLLFGGSGGPWSNQTWVFAKGAWTQLHPTHAPPPTTDGAMAFDAADNYALLFGGFSNPTTCGCLTSAAWEYSSGDWHAVVGPGPTARAYAGMLYDPILSSVVLYGGYGHSNFGYGGLGYWTWSFVHGNWTRQHLTPTPPYAFGPGFAFDAKLGSAIAFGGEGNASQPRDDTWGLT